MEEFVYGIDVEVEVILSTAGKVVLDPALMEILATLKEHGSIARAASALGRSYRYVWGKIGRVQEESGVVLVSKVRGGIDGGGTSLTPAGEHLLHLAGQVIWRIRESLEDWSP